MPYGNFEIACEQKCNKWAKVLLPSPVPVIYLCFPAVLLLGVFCHAWIFLPVTLLCAACLRRSGRSQRLPLYVCQSLLRQVSGGKQTTQSAYMLSAPWAAGSPHVRSHFCLMMCLLWCLYRNNLIPGRLCVLGALEAMQRKHLGGAKCAQWPSHPQNPIERGEICLSPF